MTTMNLPVQSFLALAAIGWADGSLQRVEATGIVRAAKEAGVGGADLDAVGRAAKEKTTLDAAGLASLGRWEKVLTYALASWLAALDGIASTDERASLGSLGEALGLEPALRVRAAAAANDIACLPEGGRPERYEFQKLVARLKERLPQIA